LTVKEFFLEKLPQKMPYYEKRDAQIQMAELVEQTLTNGGEALVEAGTGTGKSLAYLVPALNTDANDVVAISTGTKNLQEQLVKKDIPFLKTLWEEDFSYMLIQGRSNYLCLSKLYNTLMNEDTVYGIADLAHITKGSIRTVFCSQIQICIFTNDERRMSSQLKRYFLNPVGCVAHDKATHFGRACESYLCGKGILN